jgi:hypothetical protein
MDIDISEDMIKDETVSHRFHLADDSDEFSYNGLEGGIIYVYLYVFIYIHIYI